MTGDGGTSEGTAAGKKPTRDLLLDSLERLMIQDGYAAVSYRAVAAEAGVTPSLVQYYFPSLDELLGAAVRRRSEQNIVRLRAALAERPDEPLRVTWDFSREEATATLMTEFTALSNHRKSIRAVIAEVTEQVREIQLSALRDATENRSFPVGDLTPEALLYLLAGIPKLMSLEKGIGVETAHAHTVQALESYLDAVEPRRPARPDGGGGDRHPSGA
ncbi:TetR/AcrR family transcriptional regulator [Blastococcus sp. URHD0036]|uniref:TetR/AcrR family transcriptional regulator n=1 Tax=Blastococcus sp. URHD0036 TaxID=1380356 RepID=UPI00068A1230|nr:TetR/AcrR family transcriptional regulator [Blastococcus sp. URHD0036]